MNQQPDDNWASGDAYEAYMGRWSRPLASTFIRWLGPAPGASWLDVGCGTGALTAAICEVADPASVVACDPSAAFVEHARKTLTDGRVTFAVAGAEDPPGQPGSFDWIVSGLVLNLVREPERVTRQLRERLRGGGTVAACVWDYGDGFEFLRCFWDEVAALDASASSLDEAFRFPLCQPEALRSLFLAVGLEHIAVDTLELPTHFRDFDDYWTPFTRGTGPAPSYVASLSQAGRERLRDRLAGRLKPDADGRIRLSAKAWAVRGSTGLTPSGRSAA